MQGEAARLSRMNAINVISPYHVSLPKTLFKLTRGLRRNQNIIAA